MVKNGPFPYIYSVGGSCPARKLFTSRNSLGFLNSTRTRGPPVRPTGQTNVAVARSATGRLTGQTAQEHWSDRWRQPDRLNVNFGCEHMPPVFSKASGHFFSKDDFALNRHILSSVLPNTWMKLLQVSPVESPQKLLSLQSFHHIRIPRTNLDNLVRTFPT
jgi:hypothetical protein